MASAGKGITIALELLNYRCAFASPTRSPRRGLRDALSSKELNTCQARVLVGGLSRVSSFLPERPEVIHIVCIASYESIQAEPWRFSPIYYGRHTHADPQPEETSPWRHLMSGKSPISRTIYLLYSPSSSLRHLSNRDLDPGARHHKVPSDFL